MSDATAWVQLEEFCSLLFSPRKVGRLAVLGAYIDDSGHPECSSAFVLAAFVASPREWSRVLSPWLGAVHKAGVSSFHATDCANGAEEFDGWSKVRKKKMFKELIDLLARHTSMKAYAAGIMVNDYAKAAAPETIRLLRDGPRPFTFALLVEMIAKRSNEPVAFIMDKPSKGWGMVDEQFDKMKSYPDGKPWRNNLHSLTPSNVRDNPAIQIPDLLAYETFRHLRVEADHRLSGIPKRPSRQSFVRLVREKKPIGSYFDESCLSALVERGRELGVVSPLHATA